MLRFNNPSKSLRAVGCWTTRARRAVVVAAEGAADRLTATVPALAPGRWRVEWQVLSKDGHVVSGRFEFRLAP